jgi:myo-inositol 2-dehydrogenase / D-chiro-inositol 1-dehydrogenase
VTTTQTGERPVRVAVVGAGKWGQQHARVFSSLPGSVLCAVVARNREHAETRAAQWHARAYTSVAEMLASEHPDLVTLSLPNEAHFEPTLEVLEAGVPVLAEKPLVFDLSQAAQLIEAAQGRKLFFAINFNHRYAEPVRRAQATLGRGELGEVVFATWRFGGEPSNSSHPHANLIETQCHGLDMLELLCGPVSSVMAQMSNRGRAAYTTLAVALEFANGAVGSLVGSYDSSYAYPSTHYLEVNGTRGRVLIEDTVQRFTLSKAGEESREVWEACYFNDFDREFHRTFDKHAAALLMALRAGEAPPVPASAGYRALQLAYAIISSFEGGRRVAVPASQAT